MGISDATSGIVVLGNLTADLIQVRAAVLHGREKQRSFLHSPEHGPDAGGAVDGPVPESAVLPRGLFAIGVENREEYALLIQPVDQESVVNVAVAIARSEEHTSELQ